MNAAEILTPQYATPQNPRWHELRRSGVTASEISAVMGISPWQSPFSLYWAKANGWVTEDNEHMATGRRLEPVIADWWQSQHLGEFLVQPAGLYTHPDRPYQLATPDRLLYLLDWSGPKDAPDALLECKWVAYSWEGWGEPGSDDIPVHYRAQCLWQADVLGVDEVHVAALGPGGFRAYLVRRDEDDLAVMRKAGAEFHRRLVEQDPPPLDSHTATLTTLKRLHPTVGEGDVEVPTLTAIEYLHARIARKDAENRIALAEAEIRSVLGSTYARATRNGQLVASRSVYEQQRIDTARLRKERPDIAAEYTTTTTVDRLNPGRSASYIEEQR